MMLLIMGLVLWFATHLFAVWAPGPRSGLTETMGTGGSKGLMAVLTVIAVALMVIGYQDAPYVEVWLPPAFLVHLNNLLMLVAVLIFIAGNIPSPVRNRIRHPQLTATKIWAAAHLLVNGDVASIILFGGILAWAVLAMIGTNKRDGKPPLDKPSTTLGLVIHLVATGAVFMVITLAHNWAGIWPFPT